jgi:hypothetical protein
MSSITQQPAAYPLTTTADAKQWVAHPVFLATPQDRQDMASAQGAMSHSGIKAFTAGPPNALHNGLDGSLEVRLVDLADGGCSSYEQTTFKGRLSRSMSMPPTKPAVCERGLFTCRRFHAGEFVVPYTGTLLDWQAFATKYPAQDVGRRIWVSQRQFCKILGGSHSTKKGSSRSSALAGSRRYESSEASVSQGCTVQLRKCDDWNVSGQTGQLTGRRQDNLYEVILDGYHQANYTLTLPGLDMFIDADIALPNGSHYLCGLGALVNSCDPEFARSLPSTGVGTTRDTPLRLPLLSPRANVEYQICASLKQAAIVVLDRDIEPNTELLASYDPKRTRVLSEEQWNTLVSTIKAE